MNKQNQAFTLVELIVVITIIAILGTIAFISLQGYSASSRDSVRISDISHMKISLELFNLNAGKYPLPDDKEEITYEGELLWYQGVFGNKVVSQLSKSLNKAPLDPLTDKKYIFSTTNNKNEFQLLALLEGDLAMKTITQTNAASVSVTPRVDGQYNGVFIKTDSYYVPTPSIITSEQIGVGVGLVLTDTNIKSQVTTGGSNIPSAGVIASVVGKLNINLSVFTGSIDSTSTTAKKIELMDKIKAAYTLSTIANQDIYKTIIETTSPEILIDRIVLKTYNTFTTTQGGGGGGSFVCPAGFEGNGQAITTDGGYQIRVSPDGTNIIYSNTSQGNYLYKKLMDSSVTDNGVAITSVSSRYPTFSPDGTKIVYLNESVDDGIGGTFGQLYIKSATDNSDGIMFTNNIAYVEWVDTPVYSPNGNNVIYRYDGPDGSFLLKKSVLDTSTGSLFTTVRGDHPLFTLDGNFVIYSGNDGNLYKMPSDGSNDGVAITVTGGNRASLSPDGQSLIYNRYNSDLDIEELYIKSANDNNDGTLLVGGFNVGSFRSVYSKDGNYIIYTNSTDGERLYKKCAAQ